MSGRSTFVCFLSTIFLASLASSQVIIRERVEVKPQPPSQSILPSVQTVTKSLRLEATWTGSTGGNLSVLHGIGDPLDISYGCRFPLQQGTSGIDFTIPAASAGTYLLQLRPSSGLFTTIRLRIYLDEQLVREQSATNLVNFDVTYTTPYASFFAFDLWSEIFFEESTSLMVVGQTPRGCTSTQWDAAEHPVTVSIVSGAEYVNFRNIYTRARLGSSITRVARDLDSVALAADGALPDSAGAMVVVRAESNGLVVLDTVRVKPYYFRVSAEPSSVKVGEEAQIIIEAVDAQGNRRGRVVSPVARIGIADSVAYGTLEYNESMADTLEGIETVYGGVKFLANEKAPRDSVVVRLFAEKTDEGSSEWPVPPELYPFDARDTVKGSAVVVVKRGIVLDHFALTLEKDTLAFTETSKIFVQAKDVDDRDIEFDADALLKLSVETNED